MSTDMCSFVRHLKHWLSALTALMVSSLPLDRAECIGVGAGTASWLRGRSSVHAAVILLNYMTEAMRLSKGPRSSAPGPAAFTTEQQKLVQSVFTTRQEIGF